MGSCPPPPHPHQERQVCAGKQEQQYNERQRQHYCNFCQGPALDINTRSGGLEAAEEAREHC